MTTMIQVKIEDASDEQLRTYARGFLQLEVGDFDARPAILSTISRAWPNDFILVASDADTAMLAQDGLVVEPVGQRLIGSNGADDPTVIFKILQTPMPGGKDPVPVGVNGVTVVLQRNINITAPYRFYRALLDANQQSVDWVQDGTDPLKSELVATEVTNYPIQHVSLPSPSEIAAWEERTRGLEMA